MAITRRSFRRVRSTRIRSRRIRSKCKTCSRGRTSKSYMKRRYKTSRRMKGGDGDAGDSVLALVKEYAEKGYLKKMYNKDGTQTKIKQIKDAILNVLTGLKGTTKDNYGPKLSCPKFVRWRRKECELKKSVGYYWAYKMLLQERNNDTDNDGYYLDSDLTVAGSVTGDMISATYKVNAGTGVTAGPLGFATLLGGVSAGLPVAVPGEVNALFKVSSILINGIQVRDIQGTMMGMRMIYNFHKHPAPKGITGLPIKPML